MSDEQLKVVEPGSEVVGSIVSLDHLPSYRLCMCDCPNCGHSFTISGDDIDSAPKCPECGFA